MCLVLLSSFAAFAGAADVSWDTIVRLTTDPASQIAGYSGQHSVAVDAGGNVHVAWLDQRDVPYQVWYRRYDAGSGAWLAETVLTSRPANCFRPGIACDGAGNVYVVWHFENYQGPGIWCKRYDAAAELWKPDTLIDSTTTLQPQFYPAVACAPGSGDVALAWYGLPDTGMYAQAFLKERNPASGWDSAVQVSTVAVNHDQVSVAASENGDVAVVWCGNDLGSASNQVLCRRRVDGTWQNVELVSDLIDISQYAPVAAFDRDGALHIVWHGRSGLVSFYQQVFHRSRDKSGWSAIDSVSGTRSDDQNFPSIALDRLGRYHVVWCSKAGSEHTQLLYGQRDTNGVWSSPVILTGLDSGDVGYPSIACDSDSGIHIVWHDDHSGNQDIYYLRGVTPGAALAETPNVELRATNVRPTLVRGVSLTTGSAFGDRTSDLFDACGRAVADATPGVYFIRTPGSRRLARVVVAR